MKNNRQARAANLLMLQVVAEKLADLCDEVAFLGGVQQRYLFLTQ